MSGGHYDYLYSRIEDMYENELEFPVLEALLKDFCKLLRSLEWYKSGDTSDTDYYKDAESFINKWIKSSKGKVIKKDSEAIFKIEKFLDSLKQDMYTE